MTELVDADPATSHDTGVSRRVVLAATGVLAAATAVGCSSSSSSSSGSGSSSGGSGRSAGSSSGSGASLAKVTDIPDGSSKVVTADGKPIVLVRKGQTVTALSAICTHAGCTVNAGKTLNCPCHGSKYDLSGKVLNGPAPRPLAVVQVTVRNGEVFSA